MFQIYRWISKAAFWLITADCRCGTCVECRLCQPPERDGLAVNSGGAGRATFRGCPATVSACPSGSPLIRLFMMRNIPIVLDRAQSRTVPIYSTNLSSSSTPAFLISWSCSATLCPGFRASCRDAAGELIMRGQTCSRISVFCGEAAELRLVEAQQRSFETERLR